MPTRSPVQALAALAVRDAGRRFEDDVIAMAEAAGACRYAEVTHASREALTVAGRCQPGDVLALVEGEVNLIGSDLADTCRDLLDRLLAGGGELVTLLIGADAPATSPTICAPHLAQHWPFVEAQVYEGGQPNYPVAGGRASRAIEVATCERRSPDGLQMTAPLRQGRSAATPRRRWPTHLDLHTVGDLVYHFPRRYDERGEHTEIRTLAVGEQVTVLAQVRSRERHARSARART